MDPLTIMTIVSTAAKMGQSMYNGAVGMSAADEMRRRTERGYNQALDGMGNQYRGQFGQLVQGIGQARASAAARGLGGVSGQMTVDSARDNAFKGLREGYNTQLASLDEGYNNAMDQATGMANQALAGTAQGMYGATMDFISTDYSRWENSKPSAFNYGGDKPKVAPAVPVDPIETPSPNSLIPPQRIDRTRLGLQTAKDYEDMATADINGALDELDTRRAAEQGRMIGERRQLQDWTDEQVALKRRIPQSHWDKMNNLNGRIQDWEGYYNRERERITRR